MKIIIWLIGLLVAFPLFAKDSIEIATGTSTSSYVKIGNDIAQYIAKPQKIDMVVKPSNGSLHNIAMLNDKKGQVSLAIIQSDTLPLIKNDKQFKNVLKNLRLVYPLHQEDVHLLAQQDIKHIKDLAGKKVAIGLPDSGHAVTARNIIQKMQLDNVDIHEIPPKESIVQILSGRLDAMFYVGEKPYPLLGERIIKLKENAPPAILAGLKPIHFVPLNAPELNTEEYTPNLLTSDDYPWMEAGVGVPNVTVKSLLVSWDYSVKRNLVERDRCRQIEKIASGLKNKLSDLKKQGETKQRWSDIELSSIKKNDLEAIWKADKCAHPPAAAPKPPPVRAQPQPHPRPRPPPPPSRDPACKQLGLNC